MGRRFLRTSICKAILSVASMAVLSSFSLNAQGRSTSKVYGSTGIIFSFMDKDMNSVRINESVGVKLNDFALFIPISIEERMYNLSTTKNFDMHGLLGLGASWSFGVSKRHKIEMALSGQSTVTQGDFRFALFSGDIKLLSPYVFGMSFIGVGVQYYKNYSNSPGTDGIVPCISLGFQL